MRRTLSALLLLTGFGMSALAEKPGVGPQYLMESFGTMPDGKTVVTGYTLVNKNGMKAKVIEYGGIVTELHVPDKDGQCDYYEAYRSPCGLPP